MNSNYSRESRAWTIGIAGTLLLASTSMAHAKDGVNFREFRQQNPDIQRREAREMFQQLRGENYTRTNASVPTISIPQLMPATSPGANAAFGSAAIQTRTLSHSKQLVESGRMIRLERGIDLDLTSNARNITLGSDLFEGQSSIQIKIGNDTKTLSAGSQVSAAEYVAVKQVIESGSQQLVLEKTGRATGGTVDLGALTQDNDVMRASNLVVAKDVTTYGDFGNRSDFRLLGDLDNYGTIHADSSSKSVRSGTIRAEDINNFSGANITSSVALTLDASGNLNNSGTISSQELLTLTAGGAVNNSGIVNAKGDVNITSASVNNRGSIATGANLNLNGASGFALTVNNSGGTLTAGNAINVRDNSYADAFNSTISGGDLFSKQLNLNSGLGTVDVAVNALTGTVNQTGTAAHVLAQTDVLNIGEVCLTGDPTYYNTRGDINIDGNISVAEALVFVAAGNITSVDNVSIVAGNIVNAGYDITFIAGAGFTPTGSSSDSPNPPTVANPGGVVLTGKASKTTNLLGEKIAGGSIDLGNNVTVAARSSLTPVGSTDGADINMFAFEAKKGDGTGKILIEGATLRTGGSGFIGTNGDVTILASASEGEAIRTGNIDTTGGTGSGGNISINVTKIYNPIKKIPVEYNALGQRVSNSILTGFGVRNGGITIADATSINSRASVGITGGDVFIQGAITGRVDVGISALGSIIQSATAPAITASATGTSSIQLSADKGSVGAQGAPIKVDTETLRIPSGGQRVNVEVVGTGGLLVNGAKSSGNITITAPGRVMTSSGGEQIIEAGGNVSLYANTFFQMNQIIAGDQLLLQTATGDITNTQFLGGFAAQRLVLITDNGNVGANAGNRFAIQGIKEVEVNSANGAFLNMLDAKKGATFTGINAGADINIRGAGSLTFTGLTNSSANATDIEIAGGTLTIAGTIQATESLRLVNPNVKGKMIFAAGVDIGTMSASDGDILISLGPTSVNTFTPVDNVTVSGAGGSAFFTGNGFKTKTPTNNFVLKGADIFVNNGTKAGNMTFNGDVTVTADPPVVEGTPTFFVSYDKGEETGIKSDTTPQPSLAMLTLPEANASMSAASQAINLFEVDALAASSNVITASKNQTMVSTSLSKFGGSQTCISLQRPSTLEYDADVVTVEPDSSPITEGNKLFIASKDMSIESNFGTVKLTAGSVVLISAGKAHLSVYNLHDAGGVSLVTNGKRLALLPGKHVTLSKSLADSFTDVNQLEAIPHRSIQRVEKQNGPTVFCSEFSLPSAFSTVKPLKAMFSAKDRDTQRLASKLTKTAAVLMHINNGNYELQVKPRVVALN